MSVWNIVTEAAVRLAEKDTEFDPNTVSPGVEGFIFTGLMAVLVIVLGFVLVKRMRKSAYRHQVREQIEAELAAAEAAEGEEAALIEADEAAKGEAPEAPEAPAADAAK